MMKKIMLEDCLAITREGHLKSKKCLYPVLPLVFLPHIPVNVFSFYFLF
jgi:hypothetical protein